MEKLLERDLALELHIAVAWYWLWIYLSHTSSVVVVCYA